MIFKGIDDQNVEFRIISYQFPLATIPDEYDSNWLNIYLGVKSKSGHWQTIDPSLLTWDVEKLIEWFSYIAGNKTMESDSLEFIEPNLSFHLIDRQDDFKKIRIKFDLESRPRSAKDNIMYYVDCLFSSEDLKQIGNELAEELSKFPKR